MSSGPQFISGVSATNNAQVVAGIVHGSVYFGDNESKCSYELALLIRHLFEFGED
jgi:hypothetical protein